MSTRYGIMARAHRSTSCVTMDYGETYSGTEGPMPPAEELPLSHYVFNHMDFQQCSSLCHLLLGALSIITLFWH